MGDDRFERFKNVRDDKRNFLTGKGEGAGGNEEKKVEYFYLRFENAFENRFRATSPWTPANNFEH